MEEDTYSQHPSQLGSDAEEGVVSPACHEDIKQQPRENPHSGTSGSILTTQAMVGFFLAGLFNNSSYVIMIAGAKHISPSMVGLVYVCNVIPSITIKGTGPYWFHYFAYKLRMIIAAVLMAISFILVAIGSAADQLWLQLLGVVLSSAQSGFGEASYLALTAFYNEDSRKALTYWSSGTGAAGIFGYAWVVVFTVGMKATFEATLYVALILPVLFVLNFLLVIKPPAIKREKDAEEAVAARRSSSSFDSAAKRHDRNSAEVVNPIAESDLREDPSSRASYVFSIQKSSTDDPSHSTEAAAETQGGGPGAGKPDLSVAASVMTFQQRLYNTAILWPFMIPLTVVYFAEYAMQSGVWAAIGFPVSSTSARDAFYEYSNWVYQAGVLVSRSSGLVVKADIRALWIMPMVQVLLLLFFLLDAYYQFWYDWSLLIPCFVVGLLGGAVYVGGFSLIAETVDPSMKEFSLSAASLADGVGIALSNIAGIFIQAALYRYHDLSDDS